MKIIKIFSVLILLIGCSSFLKVSAQTTYYTYDAGDNSGYMVQLVVNSDYDVSKVNIGKKGDANWTSTVIEYSNDNQDYFRVKSSGTGRVYEMSVDWYNDKVVLTLPEGNSITYWLRKS